MFQKPFSFTGRIRRLEYGLSQVIVFVLFIFIVLPFGGLFITNPILFFLFGAVANWFLIMQGVKRCHDLGNSGWYMFIPFYGLMMLFSDGELGSNRYGPNPKGLERPPILASNQQTINSSLSNTVHQTTINQSVNRENSGDKKSNHALFFWLGIVIITIIFLMIRSVSYHASELTKMIEHSNQERQEDVLSEFFITKNEENQVIEDENVNEGSEILEQSNSMSQRQRQDLDCPVIYSVQVVASSKKLSRDAIEFRNLDYKIEERYFPNEKIYKYKYVVGKECSLTEIKKLRRKLRKLGFKGAFIVKR
jgi:uncharacterized membrane protein YhaH (DUF805 family)